MFKFYFAESVRRWASATPASRLLQHTCSWSSWSPALLWTGGRAKSASCRCACWRRTPWSVDSSAPTAHVEGESQGKGAQHEARGTLQGWRGGLSRSNVPGNMADCLTVSHLRWKGEGAGLLERPRAGAEDLDTEIHWKTTNRRAEPQSCWSKPLACLNGIFRHNHLSLNQLLARTDKD